MTRWTPTSGVIVAGFSCHAGGHALLTALKVPGRPLHGDDRDRPLPDGREPRPLFPLLRCVRRSLDQIRAASRLTRARASRRAADQPQNRRVRRHRLGRSRRR